MNAMGRTEGDGHSLTIFGGRRGQEGGAARAHTIHTHTHLHRFSSNFQLPVTSFRWLS